jgi:hypothetical protein
MNYLPSAADSSLYGWKVLLILLAAALLPAAGILIWTLSFQKRGRRKSRRRRRGNSSASPAIAQTNGATSGIDRENTTGQLKS